MPTVSPSTIDIKTLLAYYIRVVLDGDLKKLDSLASISEEQERSKLNFQNQIPQVEVTRPAQTVSSAALTTTVNPSAIPLYDPSTDPYYTYLFDSETARCAIPMGMTLICLIEFIGSLLIDPYKWEPKTNLKTFFDESGHFLDDQELELLRINFRNGMMHAFFPKGEEIGISYDSHVDQTKLFFQKNNVIILNVKPLLSIVSLTIRGLFHDTSKHETMRKSYEGYLLDRKPGYDNALLNYRITRPTNL